MTTRAAKRKRGTAITYSPQRAMQGPYVAPDKSGTIPTGRNGMAHPGGTNAEMLAAIVDVLGGPPERGALYRVRFTQGATGTPVQFIGEYIGLGQDRITDKAGRIVADETALRFACRNPVLPANAEPFVLWPLDIDYIAHAEPGDLDVPMHYQVEGEPEARPVGRPPVQ